jgi:hypothetical protein
MEAELLRGMIADRDLRMEKIRRKSEEQAQRNIELCRQLETVTAEVQQQSQLISKERNQFTAQYQSVIDKLEQMQRDFKQQGASLKTYSKDTSLLGKVGANGDASYVMRMQAQLCKAMHSLGITDHQMELATKHMELIVKYQKETLIQCREERTSTELNLMNQLIEKDNERRSIEQSYQAKLDVIAKEREALERQMEESGHNLDDDEEEDDEGNDDEEEDEEEKEMKQELMQLLTERRAEIERLEIAIEEQEDIIAELEEQVADMVNSPNIAQRKGQELSTSINAPTEDTANSNEDHEDGEEDEVDNNENEVDVDDDDDVVAQIEAAAPTQGDEADPASTIPTSEAEPDVLPVNEIEEKDDYDVTKGTLADGKIDDSIENTEVEEVEEDDKNVNDDPTLATTAS